MLAEVADGSLMPAGVDAQVVLLEALEARQPGLRTPDALRAIARLRAALGDRAGAAEAWQSLFERHMLDVRDSRAAVPVLLDVGACEASAAVIESVGGEELPAPLLADWAVSAGCDGRRVVALEALMDGLDRWPADPHLLAALAWLRVSEGQPGTGLITASQAIAAAEGRGDPPPARALWSRSLALASTEPALAADAFAEASAADPGRAGEHRRLRFLLGHGAYETAAALVDDLQADMPLDDELAVIRRALSIRRDLLQPSDVLDESASAGEDP